MNRFSIFFLTAFSILSCATDSFEEEINPATVFFNIEASASEGGSVDTSGGSIASGAKVTITATPNQEYIFTGWTGTSLTENPLTITADSNLTITANFEKRKYPLVLNITGEGTVTEEIINTGKSTDYDSGSLVKLTAVPGEGYALMRWENNGVLDTLNSIQLTIDQNKIVDVNFDYQTARDLVGTWEFDLQENETAKSNDKITMRIDIQLNILFTMIRDNITTQFYSQLNTLNNNTLIIGDFGALTNVNITSSSSLNFNVLNFPDGSAAPTSANEVPSATLSNSLNLTGNKISDNSSVFTPPNTAVSGSLTNSQINPQQVLSDIVLQVAQPEVFLANANELLLSEMSTILDTSTISITIIEASSIVGAQQCDSNLFSIEKNGQGKIYNIQGDDASGYTWYEYENKCFLDGESIFLTAVADDGYNFYGWLDQDGNMYDLNSHRIFEFANGTGLNLTANFVPNNYTEDPLYSKLNQNSTPLEFVNVFIEEASLYGHDFINTVKNIQIRNNPGAYSLAACDENTFIDINLNQNGGGDSWSTWDFAHKMMIIYHELGHDLLQLQHICLPGHHMTGWDFCNGDTSPLLHNGREINQQDIKYNTTDPVLDWKRATKDLFELNYQELIECGNSGKVSRERCSLWGASI